MPDMNEEAAWKRRAIAFFVETLKDYLFW